MLSVTSHKQTKAQSCLAIEANFDSPATDEPWVRAQIYFYYPTQAPHPLHFHKLPNTIPASISYLLRFCLQWFETPVPRSPPSHSPPLKRQSHLMDPTRSALIILHATHKAIADALVLDEDDLGRHLRAEKHAFLESLVLFPH